MTLKPLDIVLVNTAAGKAVGNPNYVEHRLRHGLRGHDVSAGARRARDRHGRLVAGTRRSATPPSVSRETGDTSLIWEGHKAGRDIGYCHLEKLHNLEVLPPHGYTVSCFPHKVKAASAGWTRAVAIFED